jgi:hypothetical protein
VLVRATERVNHVSEEAHHFTHRQLSLSGQLGAQRLSLDEGHAVVEQTVGLPGGEHGDDVGMVKAGSELDLASKAFNAETCSKVGWQDLEHHAPAEGNLFGDEDPAHAATAELSLDTVDRAQGVLESFQQIRHWIVRLRDD